MRSLTAGLKCVLFVLIAFHIAGCSTSSAKLPPSPDGQTSLNYLKGLKGKWVVKGGSEGPFGWEFDVTSRGSVVVERLKVGTPTEMTTTYYLDDGRLHANHYCQLKNQPHLTAVSVEEDGDLHFLCDGNVGNTKSHAVLHMHGVHFKKNGDSLLVWMDMLENEQVAFQTKYELVRKDSGKGRKSDQ